jgi:hypothetical protein
MSSLQLESFPTDPTTSAQIDFFAISGATGAAGAMAGSVVALFVGASGCSCLADDCFRFRIQTMNVFEFYRLPTLARNVRLLSRPRISLTQRITDSSPSNEPGHPRLAL